MVTSNAVKLKKRGHRNNGDIKMVTSKIGHFISENKISYKMNQLFNITVIPDNIGFLVSMFSHLMIPFFPKEITLNRDFCICRFNLAFHWQQHLLGNLQMAFTQSAFVQMLQVGRNVHDKKATDIRIVHIWRQEIIYIEKKPNNIFVFQCHQKENILSKYCD